MVDYQAVNLVRHILEPVDHSLEVAIDFTVHDECERVLLPLFAEQLLQARRMNVVGLTFEADQPLGQLVQPGGVGARAALGLISRSSGSASVVTRAQSTMIAAMSRISLSNSLTS